MQAAAEKYFGKDVGALGAAEAALLAGMIRNPAGTDPFTRPERAMARRRVALRQMEALGHLT